MAYRFKHGETISQGVKRIAREEIGAAIDYLRGKGGVTADEAVHEMRKSLKRTRALLRLVRPELGASYAEENVRLRDSGRQLSPLRDAGALIGVAAELSKRPLTAPVKLSLTTVQNELVSQKHHLEEQVEAQKLKQSVTAALLQSRRSIRAWPLNTDGFSAIEAGIERTFRDGRKAMAQARKSGRREDFHEWRKRVKDHWYQVRLLKEAWGDGMEDYERSLKELEDALGEDLNLAILSERAQAMASLNGNGKPLGKAIEAARKELRGRALEIGERIYLETPRKFTRHIGRLWKTWQG